jgi:hypothetical protein
MVDSGHSVYNEAETYIDFREQSFGLVQSSMRQNNHLGAFSGKVAFVGTIGQLGETGGQSNPADWTCIQEWMDSCRSFSIGFCDECRCDRSQLGTV